MDKKVWEGKKVLVVEDDKPLQDAIVMKLTKEGINTTTAINFDQAIEALNKEGVFDAIWLDHYLLGDKDGYEVVKETQKEIRWKNIPIFLVSNTINPEKVQPYFDAGIVRFYVKSDYKLEEILNDIKSIWEEDLKKDTPSMI